MRIVSTLPRGGPQLIYTASLSVAYDDLVALDLRDSPYCCRIGVQRNVESKVQSSRKKQKDQSSSRTKSSNLKMHRNCELRTIEAEVVLM